MEVTRELRLERLSARKGTAPIRLTFRWDNRRLRLNSGEAARPADWHEKQGKLRDKAGTYAAVVNRTLERWSEAATEAHQQARRLAERWDEARMEAEIRARFQRLTAQAQGLPEEALPPLPALATRPLTFLEHYAQWGDYQGGKVSVRTGRQLSKTYLGHLRSIGRDLAAFEQVATYPLTFARINAEFYAAFQRYYLTTLGHEVNTFGSAIKKIKSFLYWCEDHDLPVSPKFHRFEAPDQYKGADFLTEAELQAWAALQVRTPAAIEYLAAHFTPPPPRPGRRGGRAVLTFEQHLERLEQARDKFLLCAYTGLRISDADRLSPRHLHGELIRLRAGKTGVQCLIPFFDDAVFRPVALVEKYAPLGLATCLPLVRLLDEYLPHLQHLVGITRLRITTRVGRKTFATLKIYQGVPKTQVMLATGHKTETSFNRYLGIDEQELLAIYRRTARQPS